MTHAVSGVDEVGVLLTEEVDDARLLVEHRRVQQRPPRLVQTCAQHHNAVTSPVACAHALRICYASCWSDARKHQYDLQTYHYTNTQTSGPTFKYTIRKQQDDVAAAAAKTSSVTDVT